MGKLDKSKLHPVEKVVTTRVGEKKTLTTLTRRYWEKPEENVSGLKKIGMNDNEIAIIDRLLEHTDQVYIVGGAVRDLLMGKIPHDFDVATNLRPDQIIELFGKDHAKTTGNVFPTVRVRSGESEIEVSTFRKEISTGVEGDRNAFKVEYADNIEDDLKRRDLTINSLALNAKTGKIVDAFGGVDDIKNRVVRFVDDPHERLREDPLRYLRAIRFKLRIGGKYAQSTKDALGHPDVKQLFMDRVSSDRIREELLKGAEGVSNFSGFFTDLHEFGMLEKLFPEVHDLIDHDGGPHHGEDVFTHSMLVGDNYGLPNTEDKRDILAKVSAYLHDIGKPTSYDPVERTFYDHENIGAEMVPDFLKRFRFSNDEVKFVQQLIANHMKKPTTLKGVRKLYTEIGDNVDYLIKLSKADSKSNLRKTEDEIVKSMSVLDEVAALIDQARNEKASFTKINVNGNDLMTEFKLKPGPHLKDMLEYAKDLVLEDPSRNDKKFLIESIRKRFEL